MRRQIRRAGSSAPATTVGLPAPGVRQGVGRGGGVGGPRHYRWFAGARIARGVAPPLLTLLGAVGVVAAVVAGYRWLSPGWSAIGTRVASWGSVAGVGALWIIG